jgi:hypothetical protein
MSQEFPGYYKVIGDYDGLELIKKGRGALLWGARTKKECQRLVTVLNYLDYYSDKFIKNSHMKMILMWSRVILKITKQKRNNDR